MNIEQVGSFRTRPTGDGSLEVWARGWRLDSPLYALIPAGLALMFVVAPMPIPMRVVGGLVMLFSGIFVFRLTKPGMLFGRDTVTIIGVVRTRVYPWEEVSGFMGERRHDEGRVLLILADETRVPLPGTLDPSELDPYGEEGEMLSAVDQLNRLGERARAGDLPKPTAPTVSAAAFAAGSGHEDPSRKERRSDRKKVREALKAVRLQEKGKTQEPKREPEAPPRRRSLRRSKDTPAEVLTPVAISEAPAAAPPRAARKADPTGPPSYFPTPTYIPQAEYAQMLRDQKAAEKAAAAAARELSELAELEELAEKEEFSDWNQ